MKKKVQITAIVIVGILILIGIFVLIYVSDKSHQEQLAKKTLVIDSTPAVRAFVERCLQKTTNKGIEYIAQRSGYYEPPERHVQEFYAPVAFYYYDGTASMPSITGMEAALAAYIEDFLFLCIRNFRPFEQQGIPIVSGEKKAHTTIRERDVQVTMHYPLEIRQKNVVKLSEFSVTVPSDLLQVFGIAQVIIDKQEQKPNFIRISNLADIGEQATITIDLIELADDVIIYTLVNNQTGLHYPPEQFMFAIQYQWE